MAKTTRNIFTPAESQKFLAFLESQFGMKLADIADRAAYLTPRELDVFHELGAGTNTAGIAQNLGISEKTLALHRDKVRLKLGTETLTGAVRAFWLFKLGQHLAPGTIDAANERRASER